MILEVIPSNHPRLGERHYIAKENVLYDSLERLNFWHMDTVKYSLKSSAILAK